MRQFTLQPTPAARRRPSRRGGFTIIELMVVVVIIAALAALLLPALQRSRRGVRVTEVRNEISQLESSIAQFKATFLREPPSAVVLHESPTGWAMDPKSRSIIRGLWSDYDFSVPRDIDGDGSANSSFALKGDQCLVFFLGGVYLPPPGMPAPATEIGEQIGFSSNPKNPFDRTKSGTRVGPFHNFDPGRIKREVPGATYSANLRDFPVYVDPLDNQTKPYLYASSYDGQGYNDTANFSDAHTPASDNSSTMPNCYDTSSMGVADFRIYRTNIQSGMNVPPAWNPKGFQIISPGFDGLYGIGGPFKPDSDPKLPQFSANVADPNRGVERDNITNFHSGELEP